MPKVKRITIIHDEKLGWSVINEHNVTTQLGVDEAIYIVLVAMINHTPKRAYKSFPLYEARAQQEFMNKHGEDL
jgi:hypothetical protein